MTLDDLQSLLAAKKALIRLELENGDWHGVRDLAADIEVLQARICPRVACEKRPASTVTPGRRAELLALLERAHWLMQETLDR
jgi:hypothetical protein